MKAQKLSILTHSTLLITTIIFAYIWLNTPVLTNYALQAFALSSLGFILIKRLNKAKIWHILPENHSYEMIFITFSTLLLVGATGNTESIFYPLTYIHLFFLVMSSREQTAISVTTATIIFHYAMEPVIASSTIATIATLPLMLLFFLFAKKQYDDAQVSHSIIKKEEKEIENLSKQEHTLETFITTFLEPKLESLEGIVSEKNNVAKNQISLIISESKKILEKIKS
jgi:hypothetical protein